MKKKKNYKNLFANGTLYDLDPIRFTPFHWRIRARILQFHVNQAASSC